MGRGYFTLKEVDAIHLRMQHDLSQIGLLPFKDFLICPHAPHDDCACRKPKPQLVINCLKQIHIPSFEAWVVGDREIDAQTATACGAHGFIIRSGQNSTYPTFKDLTSLAETLKNN